MDRQNMAANNERINWDTKFQSPLKALLCLADLKAGDPKLAKAYGTCRGQMSDHPHFISFYTFPPFQSFTFTLFLLYKSTAT